MIVINAEIIIMCDFTLFSRRPSFYFVLISSKCADLIDEL